MKRILPTPTQSITVEDAYPTNGSFTTSPGSGRPQTALCMVTSLDGSISLTGASGGLSSSVDRAVLTRLRYIADLIIVGAGTVRDEGYGPPKKPGQRIGVVSRTGRVDPSTPLFRSGAGFLILPEAAPKTDLECIRAGEKEVDLVRVLQMLPGEPATVQIEGGAALNGAFLSYDLVDELNLTISPQMVGGDGPRLTRGATEAMRSYDIAQLCEDEGFLFARYRRRTR